ncbi:MAG: CoB--CoM heterodisulfide reductase iron-sulfur subunit B family protein [Candidatus Hydrothermarchaeaceae archaeon]
MKYGYYPGCILPVAAKEYDISTREVFNALGVELVELEDWSCCGASAIYNIDHLLSFALPARDLALAEKEGLDITTPCPVCYYNLWKVNEYTAEDPKLMDQVNRALKGTGLEYKGTARVKHILDVLANDVGVERIAEKVVRPLNDIKVVPYYGCFILRPPRKEPFDSVESPTSMDRILKAIGAEVIPWDMKTKCCGGTIIVTNEDVMTKLAYGLLSEAKALDGDCISTPCPQCNMILDSKQMDVERTYNEKISMPVVYFTQLIGLALGIDPRRLGFDLNIVPTEKLVATLKIS